MMHRIHLAVIVALAFTSSIHAQPERFELGQRLRAMEAAWEGTTDAAARQRAVPFLKKAVTTFFAFQPGEAGRLLDQARFALRSVDLPPANVQWAEALRLQPEGRFIATDAGVLKLTLLPLYKTDAPLPANARLRLHLRDAAGKPLAPPLDEAVAALPHASELALKDVPAGDHILHLEIRAGDMALVVRQQGLSVAANLKERLAALKKAADALPREALTTNAETLRAQVKLLDGLANQQAPETAYPAARLLEEAEALAAGKPAYGKDRPGQFWLTLAAGKTAVPVRLSAPVAVKQGQPLPLVVALHGAGGSENLFFEGYGQGAIVRLCEQRGWLLVAPRSLGLFGSPVADVIDEVARIYPVDPQRIFLVGHSMGAMQAVAAVSAQPERFAGVAALGGGGAPKASAGLKKAPFFIGVGAEDFALAGARSLKDRLEQAGVTTVRFQEYAGVEHIMVVPAALPAAFRLFDEAARREAP